MRRFILGFVCASILAFGVAAPASALPVDEIQTQIKVLLQQINDLMQQIDALRVRLQPDDSVVSETSAPAKHRVCDILNRNLQKGSRGDDVRGLQEFLRDEGHLSAEATGFFGPMTAQAVAKWQLSQGVSAAGAVGPISRERIKIWCGKMSALKASPTSGPAPLTVNFWHVLGDKPSDDYSIDFGDGSTGTLEIGCGTPRDAAIGACPRALVATHTYAADGVYKAVLSRMIDLCGGNPACLAPIQRQTIGSVVIRVGATVCTKEYAPVCGLKPIVCITTPCNPVPTTYGNRCMMEADGATLSHAGQCRDDVPVACTLQYDPVCGRPQGCSNTCPTGKFCAQICQLHPAQTYSNQCFLKAAKAELIHEGVCTSSDS